MAEPTRLSPNQRLWIGPLLICAGLVFFLAAFDMGPLGTADINGPRWLGAAAGGVFMAGGLAVLMGDRSATASALVGLVIVGGLAIIANWIAFGGGERVCSGPLSLPGSTETSPSSGLGCRLTFGYGALLVDSFLLLVVTRLLQKALGGPTGLKWLEKLARGLLLLAFSPVLFVLFVLTAGRSLGGALVARLRRDR